MNSTTLRQNRARAVYTSIGDGGFGPGYGLLSHRAEPKQESVLDLYQVFCGNDPEEPSWVAAR